MANKPAQKLAALIRKDEGKTDPAKPAASGDRHQDANKAAVRARKGSN